MTMEARPAARSKPDALAGCFGRPKPIVGVVHAPALPGAPNYDGRPLEEIYAIAEDEARRYAEGGLDGIIVENHGDIPFAKPDRLGPETAAVMAVMAARVRAAVSRPVGINVLANGARPALAVAKASGAAFIRVNQWANAYVANEGIIEGPAAEIMRYRAWLRAREVKVFADVHVKHGAHAIVGDRGLAELARDAWFFDADVLIATGQRTGDAASLTEAVEIKRATSLPVVVGSGADHDNVEELLEVVDGVIVASALKQDGVWWNAVDPDRVAAFMARVARAR